MRVVTVPDVAGSFCEWLLLHELASTTDHKCTAWTFLYIVLALLVILLAIAIR
jgi:hypothetical protein